VLLSNAIFICGAMVALLGKESLLHGRKNVWRNGLSLVLTKKGR
jgi:hypothetical protein